MDIITIVLLLLAGCLAGFLAGFFGVGGGIILVPILLVFFHSIGISSLVGTHVTFGTSLFIVIFAALSSTLQYSRNHHVVWRAVFVIGAASIVGALVGATIAADLQAKTLQRIFAVVVMVAAAKLMVEAKGSHGTAEPNLAPPGLLLTGIVAGLVSSLAGVGGGVFSIPIMYYLLRFPLKKALGTSSATIVITATASTIGYVMKGLDNPLLPGHTIGFVDYLHALPVIAGTIPLAMLGATIAHKTNVERLRKLYAVFLLAVAVKMFFF